MLVELVWPVAGVIAVFVISLFAYLGGSTHETIVEKRMERDEHDAQREHELALEREKTMRAQTTYPWPDPNAEDK